MFFMQENRFSKFIRLSIKNKFMKIYIASSWKNKHGVEMLTEILRSKGHYVVSWIENCNKEGSQGFVFDEWIKTEDSEKSFVFDTDGATKSDLVIYYGPAGKDACCEVGAAWAKGITIIGLYAKGEDLGLMRKMMHSWCSEIKDLLSIVNQYSLILKNHSL